MPEPENTAADAPEPGDKVMVQFRYMGEAVPDRAGVAALFAIPPELIDPDFGVIVTDESERLVCVLVPRDWAARIDARLAGAEGPVGVFANPRIAPLGPPGAGEEGEGGA
jgi:hypothetical protein